MAVPKVTQRTERVESQLPTPTIMTGGPQASRLTAMEKMEESLSPSRLLSTHAGHSLCLQPPPPTGQSAHHTPPSPGRTYSTSPTFRHAGFYMSAAQNPSPNERIPSSPRKPLLFTRHYVHASTQPLILYGVLGSVLPSFPAPRLSGPVPCQPQNSASPCPSLNTPPS